jgi:hypothetical protein
MVVVRHVAWKVMVLLKISYVLVPISLTIWRLWKQTLELNMPLKNPLKTQNGQVLKYNEILCTKGTTPWKTNKFSVTYLPILDTYSYIILFWKIKSAFSVQKMLLSLGGMQFNQSSKFLEPLWLAQKIWENKWNKNSDACVSVSPIEDKTPQNDTIYCMSYYYLQMGIYSSTILL